MNGASYDEVEDNLMNFQEENDEADGSVPWFEVPDRPISAPPILDPCGPEGLNLLALAPSAGEAGQLDMYRAWIEPPDRPSSAPPLNKEYDDGEDDDYESNECEGVGAHAGFIGSARGPLPGARQPILDPKGKGLFAFQPKLSARLPLSPPPVREACLEFEIDEVAVKPVPRRPSFENLTGAEMPSGRAQASSLGILAEEHSHSPPQGQAGMPAHLALTQSPGMQTPPPPGLGAFSSESPGVLTPGMGGMHHSGDDCPALLHPGAVRAFDSIDRPISAPFDPIDRPISAPPTLDPGVGPGMDPGLPLYPLAGYASKLQIPDIRCDESYDEFFQLYQEKNVNLPPPLDPIPDLMRPRARPGTASEFTPVPPPSEAPSEQGSTLQQAPGTGMGVAGFAAATGFADPTVRPTNDACATSQAWEAAAMGSAMQAAHATHAAAVHQAAAASCVAAHHAAVAQQAQLRQQHLQHTTPQQLGLTGGIQRPPAPGSAGAAQLAAATSASPPGHSSLLGAAGYPTASYSEGPTSSPYPWQFGMPGQTMGPVSSTSALPSALSSALPSALPLSTSGHGILATMATRSEPTHLATAAPTNDTSTAGHGILATMAARSEPAHLAPANTNNTSETGAPAPPKPSKGRGGADKQRSGPSGNDASQSNMRNARGGGGSGSSANVNASTAPSTVPAGMTACSSTSSADGALSASASGNVIGAGSANSTSPATGGSREWEPAQEKRASRSGFKISHLEDIFASNTYMNNVYSIARDQAGCRMLQHKLDEGNAEVVSAIFSEVLSHCVELMMDPFGNYLCQKLMDMCTFKQLEQVLDHVCGALVRISLNMHGARAVQKLIDAVQATPHIPRLVAALDGKVVELTKDPNGNHVVQRCLESLPQDAHHFIFLAVACDIVEVASHRHGCRIVQRCIDAAHGSDRRLLTGSICQNALTLVQDPFGNYVVQYVLGLHDPKANTDIIACMMGRLNVLSRQKFSSNVVEKCLQLCGPEDKERMIGELADMRGLGELLRDVYGNYVVQSALSVSPEPLLSTFLGAVRPLLPSLRASGPGRRIAQKLEKKYPQLRANGEARESGPNTSSSKSGGGNASSCPTNGGSNSGSGGNNVSGGACGSAAPSASSTAGRPGACGAGGCSGNHGQRPMPSGQPLAGPALRLDDVLNSGPRTPGPMSYGPAGAPHVSGGPMGGNAMVLMMGNPGALGAPSAQNPAVGGVCAGVAPGAGMACNQPLNPGSPAQPMMVPSAPQQASAPTGGRGGRQKRGRRREGDGGQSGRGGGGSGRH